MVEKSLEEKIEFLRLRSKVVTEDLLRVDNVNYLKEEVLVKISELRGAAFGLKQEVNSDGTESLITAFGGLDAAIVTLDFSYDLQKEILEQRQQEYESDEFHDELEFDMDNVKMFSAADVSLKPGGSWQGILRQ